MFLVLICELAYAQPTILNPRTNESQDITSKVQLYVDKDEKMDIEEVRKQAFASLEGKLWFLPFSDYSTWAKWEFSNPTGEALDYIIQIENALIEETEMYQYDATEQKYVSTGSTNLLTVKQKKASSNVPYYHFKVNSTGTTEIYVKLKSKRGLAMDVYVFPENELNTQLITSQGQFSFINGLLLFRLLLVLILGFFIIKVVAFRAYSFLILLKTLGFWGINNYMGPAFANDVLVAQKINYISHTSSPYAILLVGFVLIPITERLRWIKWVFTALVGLVLVNHLLIVWDYNWLYAKTGIILLTVISGLMLLLYFFGLLKKYKIQHYYAIPFLLGIGSYLLLNFRILVEVNVPFVEALVLVLFLAEILVFVFFLGKIFQDNETAKLAISKDLLQKQLQVSQLKELDELKNQFFTNISHELKTPLALISGPIKELRKIYPKDKYLNLVMPSVQRLQDLVLQLLDIQKIEEGKQNLRFEQIDLVRFLRLQVFSFESHAESKGVELHFNISHDNFTAYADVDKLSKIINNLVSNAIKYSPRNTNVYVAVACDANPELLKLSVRDEGFGIAEKDLPYIFDRFYRVENDTHQGSGVGLALVKELVTIWKGKIEVKSKIKVGTTFNLELPVDEAKWREYIVMGVEENTPPETLPLTEQPTNQSKNGKAKKGMPKDELLLIVDDNVDMQTYLSLLFKDEYRVVTANNGAEGIVKADEEVPDLIISDLMMPQMDGFAFSKKIKTQLTTSHIPIVMLTAKATKESKLEGLEIGIDHYLHKPFDGDEIRSIVRNILKNRNQLKDIFGKNNSFTEETTVHNPLEREFFTKLDDVIENLYPNTKLTVGEIARDMNLSEKQLRRKLKAISAISPLEHLRKYRLQRAAELLKTSSLSVSDIAFQTGFENLSYFSKVFSQEYGQSPSQYAS